MMISVMDKTLRRKLQIVNVMEKVGKIYVAKYCNLLIYYLQRVMY